MLSSSVVALVVVLSPAQAPAQAPAQEPAPAPAVAFDKSVLDNGLEVLVHKDARLPVVCVSVWYHVGAFHEQLGKTGFAHLFEHLMFQGTPNVPGDSHMKYLEAAGSSNFNGTTDFDRTNYYECVPKNEVELALWLESDRMAYLMNGVDQKKLDEQRLVVKNERRQAIENVPYGLAEEQLWQAMFPKEHPYYGYVIGSMADLDRASLGDVKIFYDSYYAPSNATLALAGDLEPAEAKKLIDKYFRTLPKWPKPPPRTVKPPLLDKEVRLDLVDALAQLPKVVVQYFTPASFQPDNAEMDVLAHALGTGNGARLHQALVVDGLLAQEVTATNNSLGNVSVLTITAVVKPGVNPEDVLNAIQSQLELLKDLPPTEEEIARAINAVEAQALFSLQETLGRAEQLQRYNHYTGDPGYLAKDLARFRAVTPATIQAAVTTALVKERRGVLIAAPATLKGAAPTGDAPAATPAPPAPPAKEGQ